MDGVLGRLTGRLSVDVVRVARNTLAQSAGRVVVLAAGVFTSILLARYLGPDTYGEYVFALTLVGLVSPIVSFGLDTVAIRRAANDNPHRVLAGATALKLVLAAAANVVALGYLVASGNWGGAANFLLVAPVLFLVALATPSLAFNVNQQLHLRAVGDAVAPITLALAALAIVALGLGLSWVLVAYSAAYAFGTLTQLGLARRFVRLGLVFAPRDWASMARDALPLGAAALLHQVYYRIDQVILAAYQPPADLALYSVPYGVFDQILTVFSFLSVSLFPLMLRRQQQGGAALRAVVERGLLATAAAAVLAAVATALAGPLVLTLLYGVAYASSGTALRILALALPLVCPSSVASYALVTLGAQRHLWRATAVGVPVNIALNLVLVPRLSFVGASYATVLTELAVVTVQIVPLLLLLRRAQPANV